MPTYRVANAVVREITDAVLPEGYNEITALKFMIPSTSSKYLGNRYLQQFLGERMKEAE